MKTTASTSILRKPKDGESALYIAITPEMDTYPAYADGHAEKATEHTVTARLYYGTVAQEDWTVEVCTADDAKWYTAENLNHMIGDIYVNSIKKSGADCVINYTVSESNWRNDNAYIIIRMKNKYGTVTKQVNCFAQKRGEPGTAGAVMRGPQAWTDCAVGYSFYAGETGEEWKDVVLYKGAYYSCVTSHVKTATNYPLSTEDTNGGYWKLADKMEMVATKILLSQYALVKNLGVETIDMKDDKGNIIFQAKDGNVICNKGTFKNIEITMGDAGGVGGSDCPIWVGGGGADKAVFKVDKSGRLQANTIGYDISLPDPIDDKPTCISTPVWLWAKDEENEQSGAAQMFTLETSVIRISPNDKYFSQKGDGNTPDNLLFCIPLASDVGKLNLEIYVDNPVVFKNSGSNVPDVFICQGRVTGKPTKIENGTYISSSYNCSIQIYSSSDGSSAPTYRIYDPMHTENFIWKQYFPNIDTADGTYRLIGLEYGYIELKKCQGMLPRYLRLLSNGKNWYLLEYRY